MVLTMMPMLVGAVALMLAAWRVNNEPFEWWYAGSMVFIVFSVVIGAWDERRKTERETLPRKRRLEALLRELDAR